MFNLFGVSKFTFVLQAGISVNNSSGNKTRKDTTLVWMVEGRLVHYSDLNRESNQNRMIFA